MLILVIIISGCIKNMRKKTFFITKEGSFYYTKMSFGLKNVEGTYQRLVNKMFNDQLGKNMKAYGD